MKKYTKVLFIGVIFLMFNNMVFAADRAVEISIGSNGAGNEEPTIASVRQIVGHALGSGVVDKFVVTFPVEGGETPDEGALSACAEAGFGIVKNDSQDELPIGFSENKFEALVEQLRSIQADPGVSFSIKLAKSCDVSIEPHVTPICGGIAGISCPASLICIDDPRDNCDPNNGGSDCIGICVSDGDAKLY